MVDNEKGPRSDVSRLNKNISSRRKQLYLQATASLNFFSNPKGLGAT